MWKKFAHLTTDLVILFAISLIPLLWFPKGYVVTGNDAGYPINVIETFKNRLFTWNSQDDYGVDNTINISAVPIHGIEASFKVLGFSLDVSEKLAFVVWFLAMELSMYFFAYSLRKTIPYRFFPLIATILYSINFFLLAQWRYGAATTFSAYCALPLVTAFVLAVVRRDMQVIRGAVAIGMVTVVFNGGGGFGLPLFGGLLVIVTMAFLYFTLLEKRTRLINMVGRVIVFALLVIVLSVILNAYWWMPFANYVRTNYTNEVAANGGAGGFLAWANAVSKFTSIINLFRLQGIPEWYDNAYHPFANWYLTNPLLILISFLFAPLAYLSLYIAKRVEHKKLLLFFVLVSLVDILFAAGTHPPTGWIFAQFVLHIPGFEVFRSAQYKFIPGLYFAFAILISYTVNYVLEETNFVSKFRFLGASFARTLAAAGCIIVLLVYHFPYIQTGFFYYTAALTTRLKVPEYLIHFDQWSKNHLSDTNRLLILPRYNSMWKSGVYTWKYFSLYSLFNHVRPKPFVEDSQLMNDAQFAFLNRLAYELITNGPLLRPITTLLQTPYTLLTKDIDFSFQSIPSENPKVYQDALARYPTLWQDGPWEVHVLPTYTLPGEWFALNQVTKFNGPKVDTIGAVVNGANNFFQSDAVNQKLPNGDGVNLPLSNTMYAATCESCALDGALTPLSPTYASILPGSLLYTVKLWGERSLENASLPQDQLIGNKLGLSFKRIAEISNLILQKRSERIINDTIRRTEAYWRYVAGTLSSYTNDSLNYNLIMIIELYAKTEKSKVLKSYDESEIDSEKQELTNLINQLDGVLAMIAEKRTIWSSKRQYRVPAGFETGELFMDATTLGKNPDGSVGVPTNITLGMSTRPISPKITDEKVSLGSFDLRGISSVTLSFPDERSVLIRQNNQMVNAFDRRNKCVVADVRPFNWQNQYKLHITGVNTWPDEAKIYLLRKKDGAGSSAAINYLTKPDIGFEFDHTSALAQDIYFSGTDGDIAASLYFCISKEGDPNILLQGTAAEQVRSHVLYLSEADQAGANATVQKVTYRRIDQTKYAVDTGNNTFPMILVFNQNYNNQWKLYDLPKRDVNNKLLTFVETWFRKPLPESDHFTMYGYANAWYMDKKPEGTLTAEFYPQQLLYKGVAISVISIMVVFGMYAMIRRKKQ